MHSTVKSVSTLEDKYEAMQGQTSGHLDSLKSRQSTLENKQSLQEQTLTLHGTQLADNSEKIAQTSSEISILCNQQSQTEVRIEQLSAEQNKQMSEFKDELSSLRELTEGVAISQKDMEKVEVKRIEEVDLLKQQKGKYIIYYDSMLI